jgi:hypothetical protein
VYHLFISSRQLKRLDSAHAFMYLQGQQPHAISTPALTTQHSITEQNARHCSFPASRNLGSANKDRGAWESESRAAGSQMRWDMMGSVGRPLVRHTTRPDSCTAGSGGGGSGADARRCEAVRCGGRAAGWADHEYLPTYLPTYAGKWDGEGSWAESHCESVFGGVVRMRYVCKSGQPAMASMSSWLAGWLPG